MLPYLANKRIYSFLELEDKLNFQKALGSVINPEDTFEELFGYVCPICPLLKCTMPENWCTQYPNGYFMVDRKIYDIFQYRGPRLNASIGLQFSSLELLIRHIYVKHLDDETVQIFEVKFNSKRSKLTKR